MLSISLLESKNNFIFYLLYRQATYLFSQCTRKKLLLSLIESFFNLFYRANMKYISLFLALLSVPLYVQEGVERGGVSA